MAHGVERPGTSDLFVLNALLVFLSPYLALSFRPLGHYGLGGEGRRQSNYNLKNRDLTFLIVAHYEFLL